MLLAVHYRVMEHVGSLESTQEARVALGYCLGQLLRFFCALQTFLVPYRQETRTFYIKQAVIDFRLDCW